MSFFKGSHNQHEITAYVHTDGSVTYTTEAIQEQGKFSCSAKEFSSLSAIEAAIDKYELSLRKKFTNTKAHMIDRAYRAAESTVQDVTVTSVTADGKEAWIKTAKDERRKVSLDTLFRHREVCQAYVAALAATMAVYEKECGVLKDVLNRSLWKPEVES